MWGGYLWSDTPYVELMVHSGAVFLSHEIHQSQQWHMHSQKESKGKTERRKNDHNKYCMYDFIWKKLKG